MSEIKERLIAGRAPLIEFPVRDDDSLWDQRTKRMHAAAALMWQAADEIERLEGEVDDLACALQRVQQWADAYPETVFHTPDLERMRAVLTEAGMPTSLDAAHGTWGRYIAKGVGDIARAALEATND